MALQTPVRLETAAIAFGSLTTNSVHDIGTIPDNCVVLAAGAECTSAATIGGANAVSFGVTGGDVDSLGTADINGAKTLAATTNNRHASQHKSKSMKIITLTELVTCTFTRNNNKTR